MFRRATLVLVAISLGVALFLQPPPSAHALTGFSTPLITNLVDVSATVTWVTAQPVSAGTVNYGLAKSALTHARENGTPGAPGDVHAVKLTPLFASTTYYYSVSLGPYTDDNGGEFYSFRTGPPLTGTSTIQRVTGKVLKADGVTPAVGVLVILKVLDNNGLNSNPTSEAVSALTDASGTWNISLNGLRTVYASALFNYEPSGTSDIVQYSISGGSQGDLPMQFPQMSFDASNQMVVRNSDLGPALPTLTPTPITPTLTPSFTSTSTPAHPPSSTQSPTTVPPTVAPTPTVIPIPASAPIAAEPASAAPAPAPVFVDSPTNTPGEAPAVPNPVDGSADGAPIASAPDVQIPVNSLSAPPTTPTTPTIVLAPPKPEVLSGQPAPRLAIAITTPVARATLAPARPFATATMPTLTLVAVVSPVPLATIDASTAAVPADTSGPRPTVALLAGLGLVVLGIVVVAAGVVSQTREN